MSYEAGKFYLLLGEADRETVTAKIKSSNGSYKKKRLESSLENWQSIYQILEDDDTDVVIAKLSNPTMTHMAHQMYRAETNKMFGLISKKPHVVFLHESFFINRRDDFSVDQDDDMADWYHYFGSVSDETRAFINEQFETYGVDVRTYKTNVEFSMEAADFIDNQDKNLLFRMYVSHNRMWSEEAKKVISLFKDYLTRICGINVKEDQFSTSVGTVYELSAVGSFDAQQLPTKFADFTALMDASTTDVDRATQMLVSQNVPVGIAEEIVRRYAKEARRLTVDIRQERERKLLDVRHRMESELTDIIETEDGWRAANSLVEQLMPSVYSISGTLGSVTTSSTPAPTTVLVNPQIIGSVQGFVSQAVHGNQHFGADAEALFKIISVHGGAKTASLSSDMSEIEDADTPPEKRTAAKGRLMAFLGSLSSKLGDAAIGVAQAYIEKKMGL